MTHFSPYALMPEELGVLQSLHDGLMAKLTARAEKDKWYREHLFDPDTLDLSNSLNDRDLMEMRAYAEYYNRHSLASISGVLRALRKIENTTGVVLPFEDEYMIRSTAIRNAFNARSRAQDGRIYISSAVVTDATVYAIQNPEHFSMVLSAISRGHFGIEAIKGIVGQMENIEPALREGVL